MKHSFTHNTISWIDLHQPTTDELKTVMNDFNLPPDIAEELDSDTSQGKVELRSDCIFCVIHFPAFQHTHKKGRHQQELNVVITPEAVITAHNDTIDAVHKFSKMMETESILKQNEPINSSVVLFFAILKKMYKSVYHELEYIEDWIDRTGEDIFNHKEREMVEVISKIISRLLFIKKTIHSHDEIIQSFQKAGSHLFKEDDLDKETQRTIAEYKKIEEKMEMHIAMASELRNTNNSLLSTKQNEVMRQLTVLAFIMFPLTVIAGLFNMNTEYMPLIGIPYDFWIIVAIMVVLVVVLYVFFKFKKWF